MKSTNDISLLVPGHSPAHRREGADCHFNMSGGRLPCGSRKREAAAQRQGDSR